MMKRILNCIDNQLQEANQKQYLPVFNPATGKVYAEAPASQADDVAVAVEAAKRAFPKWSASSRKKRYACLKKLGDLVMQNAEELAQLESIDNGKPLWLARMVDIPRAMSNLHFFAGAIMHESSQSHATDEPRAINYTLRQPLGVVACIAPWNLPLYLFTWKIAPALAAGNTVVAKPSEVTPMTAFRLSELAIEAGFPPGVLNVVHGYGDQVGNAISHHPDIKAISFTGSTRVGKIIAGIAAPMFKKLSLEMGGKNPNIIFADCDYENMLTQTMRSSFANQGQICLCGSRIMVERPLYEKFKKDFVERTKALKVGPPDAPATKTGAIVSEAHFNKIMSCLELAKAEGGTIICGGESVKLPPPHDEGWYIQPTIIEGLPGNCRTNQEEIFGPVVTIMPFDTESEALLLANEIPYGLSATIWTADGSRSHRMAQQIEAGIVWINTWMLRDLRTPFGGVKQSGVGREGGWEALRFFTEAKNVCVAF